MCPCFEYLTYTLLYSPRMSAELLQQFQDESMLVLDRGYRDPTALLEYLEIWWIISALLQPGKHKFSAEKSNESRLMTKTRWIVEARNSHITITRASRILDSMCEMVVWKTALGCGSHDCTCVYILSFSSFLYALDVTRYLMSCFLSFFDVKFLYSLVLLYALNYFAQSFLLTTSFQYTHFLVTSIFNLESITSYSMDKNELSIDLTIICAFTAHGEL